MCGRTAQTKNSIDSAEVMLLGSLQNEKSRKGVSLKKLGESNTSSCEIKDNFNLSPGMMSIVFCKELSVDKDESNSKTAKICRQEKVWGIVPRTGTKKSPLPEGPSKHFSHMMFNARSESLYQKRTFRDLVTRGNTCVWAIDGFFEWKQPDKNVLSKSKGKQPYYVYRKDGLPLLIPGLWNSVETGRQNTEGQNEILQTFTLLTTDACAPVQWLHHRQPVFIWNCNLAFEWIMNPNENLVHEMSSLASGVIKKDNRLVWHPVNKLMSNVKYRNADCTQPVKIETVRSVQSFFAGNVKKKDSPKNKNSDQNEKNLTRGKLKLDAELCCTSSQIGHKTNEYTPNVALKQTKVQSSGVQKKRTISNFFLPKPKKSK